MGTMNLTLLGELSTPAQVVLLTLKKQDTLLLLRWMEGEKWTSISTATVGVNQYGVVERNLLMGDIGNVGEARGTKPRYFVSLFFVVCNSCR